MTLVFATTLFALTFLGAALIIVIWGFLGTAAQDRASQTARTAAAALEDSAEASGGITDAALAKFVRDEAFLTATLPDGRTVVSGPAPEGDVYRATATAGGVTVTAEIPTSVNIDKIRFEGGIIVGLSLVVLGVSMLIAVFYARRITRPLEDFAELAGQIATGDRRQLDRRYGVPEIDAVADVLDEAVTSFNNVLENERRVTTEASHQLRTPLTALSLRLEEILATEDLDVVRAEATAALGQVERLSGVVDEVVGASRGYRLTPAAPFDVDDLVGSQVVEWSPAFEVAGRELRVEGLRGLVASAGRGAQAQALATLIENSLVHGLGTTSVRVRQSGSWAVIEVSDEGAGVPSELERRVFDRNVSGNDSSGLGLALARTLVVADGGRLEMLSARPAVFAMFLPASGEELVAAADSAATATAAVADSDQVMVAMVSSVAASASSGNTQRR